MDSEIILPPDYKPSADEEYMNEYQVEYFRQKLLSWKKSLLEQSKDTLEDLRQGGLNQPDQLDRASLEADKALDLRTKDRARKLISKINRLCLAAYCRYFNPPACFKTRAYAKANLKVAAEYYDLPRLAYNVKILDRIF